MMNCVFNCTLVTLVQKKNISISIMKHCNNPSSKRYILKMISEYFYEGFLFKQQLLFRCVVFDLSADFNTMESLLT